MNQCGETTLENALNLVKKKEGEMLQLDEIVAFLEHELAKFTRIFFVSKSERIIPVLAQDTRHPGGRASSLINHSLTLMVFLH